MAPPAQIELAKTLVGLEPTCDTAVITVSQSASLISVLLIVYHFPFLDTAAKGVQPLAYICNMSPDFC